MQQKIAATVRLACTGLAIALPLAAHAQVTLKPDGQWRELFTAGASIASGNTESKSYSASADVVRLRSFDKWAFNAAGQYAKGSGGETANKLSGTGLYTRDTSGHWFGFGQLDLLRDLPAHIASRTTLGSGLGYHVFKEPELNWDVSGGLAYTMDRYRQPQAVDGVERTRYNHAELLVSEESNHKFTDTTSFRQKLTVYPNLSDSGDVRTVFDAGLSVAMTQQLALTATLSHRYDSRPGEGLGTTDTLFVTGVSLRLD